MKILIAVPTFENIMPDTYKALWDLDKDGHETPFEFVRGYDCARARNVIAQKAIDIGCDAVLMVDNDVVVPVDALKNLVNTNEPVVLGYYAHRPADNLYDGKTCLCKLDGEYSYTHQFLDSEFEQLRSEGRNKIRIHGGGMGCALIRTEVFKKLSYPWYDWANYANGKVLSEDLYFCEMCNRNKIPIFADTRVNCGHMFRRIQEVK